MIDLTLYRACDKYLCYNLDIGSIIIGISLLLLVLFIIRILTRRNEFLESYPYYSHKAYENKRRDELRKSLKVKE